VAKATNRSGLAPTPLCIRPLAHVVSVSTSVSNVILKLIDDVVSRESLDSRSPHILYSSALVIGL
jgi:hypothetical protein